MLKRITVNSVVVVVSFYAGLVAAGEVNVRAVSVGERGVCLYGNWVSGDVVVSRDRCGVYVNGVMVYPDIEVGDVQKSDCSDAWAGKVIDQYDTICGVLSEGVAVLFLVGTDIYVPPFRREDPGYLAAIDEAMGRGVSGYSGMWRDIILRPEIVQQLASPMTIK